MLVDAILYPLAFVLTLGILVTFHEYGHYLAARCSGVRILRFSVGFGKALWLRRDKRGTEWAVAAIPLGGYVRMLDERDPKVSKEDFRPGDLSFNSLSVWWRLCIVLAGPFANIVLAMIAFAIMAAMGAVQFMPIVGKLAPGTPVQAAGLKNYEQIVSVDGAPVDTWQDVLLRLAEHLGETTVIRIGAQTPGAQGQRTLEVPVSNWLAEAVDPDVLGALGLVTAPPPIITKVQPGGPAQRGGLKAWDRIAAIDGKEVATWRELANIIRASPEQPMQLTFVRNGVERTTLITPARMAAADGGEVGFLGINPTLIMVRSGPLEAISRGVMETWQISAVTLDHIGKLIFGQVSPRNLGGPLTIAKLAGDSARSGLLDFLFILGLLSISLGLLNLLPIPILDGGHALYCLAEIVFRRPVPERVQNVAAQVGIVALAGIMLLVIVNDLLRLL